jgi:DNA-binding protein H-NS
MEIMSKSYAQIVKQIEALKQEAEKIRRGEVDGVIARIREAITFYNLTAADLGLGARVKPAADKAAPAKRRKGKGKAAKPAIVVKFRNDTGGTWGGRGKRPQWLRDALNAGKKLEDFAVK